MPTFTPSSRHDAPPRMERHELSHVTLMYQVFRSSISVLHSGHVPKVCTLNIFRRNLATRERLLDELSCRGFVSQVTKCDRLFARRPTGLPLIFRPEQLQLFLQGDSRVVYAGIDPTADSLHVGHILPMMCLVHFQIHGHKIISLVSNVKQAHYYLLHIFADWGSNRFNW